MNDVAYPRWRVIPEPPPWRAQRDQKPGAPTPEWREARDRMRGTL